MRTLASTTVFGLATALAITGIVACSSDGDSPTCTNCADASAADTGNPNNVPPDAGPDAEAGPPPAPCTGPKGDNVLAEYVSFSVAASLTGDGTYIYWEGCAPEAGPGSGVCKASKSTGAVSRLLSGRYGTTSPLAADDSGLWWTAGAILHHFTFDPRLDHDYDQVDSVEAIAFQRGVTPYSTYFSTSGMLWVSKPSAIEPVQVPGAPSGQFLAIGSSIAYILEKAGKVHRFDIARQVALGTLDVGPVSGAAWLNSALFFAESAGTSARGSLKRVDDGSNTATTLFDVASPEWLTADDDALYYADQNASSSGAAVLRLSKTPGATPSPIATGFAHVHGLSVDSSCVYFFGSDSTHASLRVYPKNKP